MAENREQTWLQARDVFWRLRNLPHLDDRKLRLFACACCRQVAHRVSDPEWLRTVELAERFADGQATGEELGESCALARSRYDQRNRQDHLQDSLLYAGYCVVRPVALEAALETCSCMMGAEATARREEQRAANPDGPGRINKAFKHGWAAMEQIALELQTDLFANPFRALPSVDPGWRATQNSAVLALARQIYTERDASLMGILADALEDAGCQAEVILEHCRQPGLHARGCWVLDSILKDERLPSP